MLEIKVVQCEHERTNSSIYCGKRRTVHATHRLIESATVDGYRVRCEVRQGCLIDGRLARAPSSVLNWEDVLGAVREMKLVTYNEPKIYLDHNGRASVSAFTEDGVERRISSFPDTINERAAKLLDGLTRK